MLIAAATFVLGLVCGLRLSLLPFIAVMLCTLAGVFVKNMIGEQAVVLSVLGDLALAALAIQAGYVAGIFIRSRGAN